jgi:hypothetical protein
MTPGFGTSQGGFEVLRLTLAVEWQYRFAH